MTTPAAASEASYRETPVRKGDAMVGVAVETSERRSDADKDRDVGVELSITVTVVRCAVAIASLDAVSTNRVDRSCNCGGETSKSDCAVATVVCCFDGSVSDTIDGVVIVKDVAALLSALCGVVVVGVVRISLDCLDGDGVGVSALRLFRELECVAVVVVAVAVSVVVADADNDVCQRERSKAASWRVERSQCSVATPSSASTQRCVRLYHSYV